MTRLGDQQYNFWRCLVANETDENGGRRRDKLSQHRNE
jgi:hypothetical protein